MGYRKMKEGVWGKPIGHIILIYREEERALYLQTVGKKKQPILWSSKDIDYEAESFLDLIKEAEAEMAIGSGMAYVQPHDLSFLSRKQIWEQFS